MTESNLSCLPGNSKNIESESSQSTGKVTPLDNLKSPTSLDLARKQKLASNPPPKGMKRSIGIVHHEPWSVFSSQRVKELVGENLSVLSEKLFCNACRETLSVNKSVLI